MCFLLRVSNHYIGNAGLGKFTHQKKPSLSKMGSPKHLSAPRQHSVAECNHKRERAVMLKALLSYIIKRGLAPRIPNVSKEAIFQINLVKGGILIVGVSAKFFY